MTLSTEAGEEKGQEEMNHEPGCRVGAILSAKGNVVRFLGYGVYEGDFDPEEGADGSLAEAMRELGFKNPRIRLDDGRIVWGIQCWWSAEEKVRAMISGKEIVMVDVNDKMIGEVKIHG